jgi:chromosome segregation ATPase
MKQLPVLSLNFSAMKSLLAENHKLRDQLETEKSTLAGDIANLKKHVSMAERLVMASRIPKTLYDQFMSVSSSLDSLVVQPKLTFRRVNVAALRDLSEELTAAQEEFYRVQTQSLEATQKRTDLALEEQKLNGRRSTYLQELAACRRECDELVLQKEKLEHEVAELQALTDFWTERNAKSESALRAAMQEVSALQQQKDAQSVQLLAELQTMYQTLDEASHFLHNDG